ncbi:Cytochrome f [Nymphaea thermarum]|nr:Cytochrome f [Nymphaea thermarum]
MFTTKSHGVTDASLLPPHLRRHNSGAGADPSALRLTPTIGGNRGRGQIYRDGSKSNNTVYNTSAAGIAKKHLIELAIATFKSKGWFTIKCNILKEKQMANSPQSLFERNTSWSLNGQLPQVCHEKDYMNYQPFHDVKDHQEACLPYGLPTLDSHELTEILRSTTRNLLIFQQLHKIM